MTRPSATSESDRGFNQLLKTASPNSLRRLPRISPHRAAASEPTDKLSAMPHPRPATGPTRTPRRENGGFLVNQLFQFDRFSYRGKKKRTRFLPLSPTIFLICSTQQTSHYSRTAPLSPPFNLYSDELLTALVDYYVFICLDLLPMSQTVLQPTVGVQADRKKNARKIPPDSSPPERPATTYRAGPDRAEPGLFIAITSILGADVRGPQWAGAARGTAAALTSAASP